MATMVAYWHRDGLDVYRYVNKKPIKYASGNLDQIKPIRRLLGKRILIVSRELLLYVRKRYPPAPMEKLKRAIALETGEIFPFSKPEFHFRVHESTHAHTTLDIWAWEAERYPRLKEIFSFNYIVPEDLAYSSDVPELKMFQYKGMTNLLAHSGNHFLSASSYPDSRIDERDVERFLSGLGRYRSDIKRVRLYGPVSFHSKGTGILETLRVPGTDYPPCMDYVNDLNLKEFKRLGDFRLSSKIELMLRFLIYLVLGYGMILYFSGKNYEKAVWEIRQKINSMAGGVSYKGTEQKVEDYSEIVREVNGRLSARPSPLRVMDMIANKLPTGSYIVRMALNEKNLEVTASSKDPISVVKALGSAEGVKTARLKGAPVLDMATRLYNFVIVMEISR